MADNSRVGVNKSWPKEGLSRIPAWIYTDPELFEREMEKFFFGDTWNYVGLECEVPEPGSFRKSWIGTKPVLMTRDLNDEIHVLENRCAHRGTPVCWKGAGRSRGLVCPYHQWTYALNGDLKGMPFIRGSDGKGGMPPSFDRKAHGMRKLKVARRGGAVWASFSNNVASFEEYCGKDIIELYDRLCPGRPLRLMGYSRQLLPSNWKLYIENNRDPYHATILHSYFITFGLFRADVIMHQNSTQGGRHSLAKTEPPRVVSGNDVKPQMPNIKSDLKLNDMGVVTPIFEFADRSMANFELFPSARIQQHANAFSMRHVIPKNINSVEITWTQFGYADDDEAMQTARLKQSNLVGPAGYVSAEDGEVLAVLQQGVKAYPEAIQVLELNGDGVSLPIDHWIQEDLLRAFYRFYRRELEL